MSAATFMLTTYTFFVMFNWKTKHFKNGNPTRKLVKGGRNQYLEKMSLINDLHPFGVPNSGPVIPASVTSAKQC